MSQTQRTGAQQSANEIFAAAAEEKVERQRVRGEDAKKHVPIKRERIVLVCLAIAVPTLVTAIVVNVFGLSPAALFEPKPDPVMARAEAQRVLEWLVTGIESYRKDYKQSPQTLLELGPRPKGTWTYTATASGYRLQGTVLGQYVSFDSSAAGARAVNDRE